MDRLQSINRFLTRHSPLLILALLCIALAIASPDFRGARNLQQVALRTAPIAILAIGQLLVILTAGIDLSVGSVAALSGVVAGKLMMDAGWPPVLAMAGGCATGAACGAINGLLVTKGRIPPFIATLAMMMAARGFALVISGALKISGFPDAFKVLGGSQRIGGASGWWVPVLIMLVLGVVFTVMLAQTRFGRSVYATGGNLTGARLSGIPIDGVRLMVYVLSGLMAGVAGLVLAARTGSADPTGAEMYELESIAACVIGGTSLMGGEGGAPGVIAGALIMTVLVNFCNLNDISVYWQNILVAGLIVTLVFFDMTRKRRAGLLKE